MRKIVKKIVVIAILILLLLLLLSNIHLTNTLISRSNEQNNKIQNLEQEVTKLENNVAYENKKIKSLQLNTSVTQKNVPRETTVSNLPLIVGTLATIGTIIKKIAVLSLTF